MRLRILHLCVLFLASCGPGKSGDRVDSVVGEQEISLLSASEHLEDFSAECGDYGDAVAMKKPDGKGKPDGAGKPDDAGKPEDPGSKSDGPAKGKNSNDLVEGQQCVLVCHRPPGNPENSKSLLIPVSAVAAHLNHGSEKHSEHPDTIGSCDGGGDGGGGGGTTEPGGVVYCDPVFINDLDCDGFDDENGEPIY